MMQHRHPPPGSRAFVYGRHSSDMQNPRSAGDQIVMGQEHCDRHRWICEEVGKDEALTGRTTVGRAGYYKMMAAAEARQIDVIVVEDISRISRDAADLLVTARKLEEFGAVIYTFGTGNVISGLELAIRAQMAQEQSQELAVRVKRGHKSAAARGRVMGGVGYGYRLLPEPDEDGLLRAIDEATAKIVVRIYEDLLAGVSPHAICKALNQEGVPPPSGKLWRSKAITGDKVLMTGIGRNPLYTGRVIYGKSQSKLIRSTGKVKVTAGAAADQILVDVPKLRMVTDEMYQSVQDILDSRSATVPNNSRFPTYLLTRLVTCGSCGAPFSMIGGGMGCTGRRYGNGCENRRRVHREDLERVVLEGLPEKLGQPHILDLYLDEYRKELAKALDDQQDRTANTRARLRTIEGEIANLVEQVKTAIKGGHASQIFNEEIERLGEQRKQLERDLRRVPTKPTLSLETAAVIERMGVLAEDLGKAAVGPERDAARARDLIRSIITNITITPIEVPGKKDGRGFGPVRVTVTGSLNELVSISSVDRVIQCRGTNFTTLDVPTVEFRFYVDLNKENSDSVEGVYPDIAVFSRVLDDAYVPVATHQLVQALHTSRRPPTPEELTVLERQVQRAIDHLLRLKQVRAVRLSYGKAGWVWNDRAISDAEWQRRAKLEKYPDPPIGVVRFTPPEACVVVITPARDPSVEFPQLPRTSAIAAKR